MAPQLQGNRIPPPTPWDTTRYRRDRGRQDWRGANNIAETPGKEIVLRALLTIRPRACCPPSPTRGLGIEGPQLCLPFTMMLLGLWFLCMLQVSKTAMLLQGNPVSLPLQASAGSLYSSVCKGVSRSAATVGPMVRPEDGQVSETRGS